MFADVGTVGQAQPGPRARAQPGTAGAVPGAGAGSMILPDKSGGAPGGRGGLPGVGSIPQAGGTVMVGHRPPGT